jgi:hypothetical protein
MESKSKMIRASFLVHEHEWQLFRTLCSRLKVVGDDGSTRQATASDELREYIWAFNDEQRHLLTDALQELEKTHPLPEEEKEE